ncbi:hypothetical protein FWJ25_00700 [Marinobacter salinexigens]|uniref:Uncharacterized protein n=1 Tax=Marinobacter salinexigens TaxID=2919747 RepID=A0A5B0VPB4_9GAMM|nr:hypothetical protein [Marinobacter salinexigens]KAA1175689.1 hypothetical protein FWJ25_00700 [Marinobacter salinexigens]
MSDLNSRLLTVAEVSELIQQGLPLALAGDEALLASLPTGNWIAGSTPYFMTEHAGVCDRNKVFVQILDAEQVTIESYDMDALPGFLEDAPEQGYSIIILPAGSDVHRSYAENAPGFPEMYLKPVVGWVAGMHLDDLASGTAVVVDGRTGESFGNRAVVLHASLPPGVSAMVHAINLFEPDEGDDIEFSDTSFSARHCIVNGEQKGLPEYFEDRGLDTRQPLLADYCGALINVSIQSLESSSGAVQFYAPVFKGVQYRVARPVADYPEAFAQAMPAKPGRIIFGCNCILNYLHSGLEGRATPGLTGPVTFGEVAYQLLNQTAVYMTLVDD